MRQMRARRKAQGLTTINLWVTAENKDLLLKNLSFCEVCGSAIFKQGECKHD